MQRMQIWLNALAGIRRTKFQIYVNLWATLIVVSAGEDTDLFIFDFIDKTVFGIDSPGPAAGEFMF